MPKTIAVALALLALALAGGVPGPARAQADVERLRDALRQAVTGLQALQAENARLQGELARARAVPPGELEAARAEAAAKDAELRRTAGRLADARRALAEGEARARALEGELAQGGRRLAAAEAEAERGRDELALTRERLADTEARRASAQGGLEREAAARALCETVNRELYDVGREVLALYDGKGLGAVLGRREPVTGLAGVRLERIVQDYRDKLLDRRLDLRADYRARLRGESPPAAPPAASPPPAPPG